MLTILWLLVVVVVVGDMPQAVVAVDLEREQDWRLLLELITQ